MILANLKPGKQAKILNLSEVSQLVQQRLLDMGIMEGSIVVFKKNFPFQGPVTIEIKGQSIGLRRAEALKIEVESA